MSALSLLRACLRLGLAAATVSAGSASAIAQGSGPIVVELFTSQGCAACPPANEYLAELAARPGIVALSFHVDYWNYLGWADPYSSKKATYRQKMYAMALRQTGVFTPQIVTQGIRGDVGSDRAAIERALQEHRKAKLGAAVALEKLGINRVRVHIGAAPDAKEAEIWLYLMNREIKTKVPRGENQGRTLVHRNVVREWHLIGQHTGEAFTTEVSVTGEKGERRELVAVLVQRPKNGAIIGAGIIDLDK
nr:DUF1223 domain-containing protein [Nitrosomonas nitrosa]